MAASAEPLLTTVQQYRDLPPREDFVQELHWGQVVTFTRPKARHIKLQSRLVRLLGGRGEHLGYVESKLPFRALPEYDLRAADVAFIARERWDAVDGDDDLHGAPELVIEVLSRSNSPAKIQALAALCLSAGTQEFWVVDHRSQRFPLQPATGQRFYTVNRIRFHSLYSEGNWRSTRSLESSKLQLCVIVSYALSPALACSLLMPFPLCANDFSTAL